MTKVRRFVRRLVTLFRPSRAEDDLAKEVRAHLQLAEDQFIASGMSAEEARFAARRAFGGVEQAKERQRDERSFRILAGWPMDLKRGMRMLAKTPGLTAIAVIALAVAIGAGAAYLEFVNDLVHPSLAAPHGDRIVGIGVWDVQQHKTKPLLVQDFDNWRRAATSFEDLGAFRKLAGHLVTADGRAEPVRGVEISPVVFRLFPTTPLLGRGLREDDARVEAAPVAVLGQELWRTRFNSDPTIVGKTIQLGRYGYTVAGVMPETFGFPLNQNLWTPLKVQGATLPGSGDAIQMFGLVKTDVSLSAAGAELASTLPQMDAPVRVEVRPYVDHRRAAETDSVTIQRLLYSGNLLFVLLLAICGANVATLVFARTATREAEITVRTALGASRRRICAQLFAEGLILSLVATLVGLLLAGTMGPWLTRMATDAIGQPLPFWWSDTIGLETILYALGLAVFSAVIVGVVPALKATGPHLQLRLRQGAVGGSSMKFGRLWTGVIVTQVAITVLFLAALVSLGWTTYRGRQDHD
nr:ABC transporter permease [Acidobacteriota bacterium]